MLDKGFFEQDSEIVSKELIGKVLSYKGISVTITETEAYGDEDPFCYGVRYGRTQRNEVSFKKGGFAFVYCGMLMVTTGKEDGKPQNVLIRKADNSKCNGPCNLVNYLRIPKELKNKVLEGLEIESNDVKQSEICQKKRGYFNCKKTLEDYKKIRDLPDSECENIVKEYADKKWRFYYKMNNR